MTEHSWLEPMRERTERIRKKTELIRKGTENLREQNQRLKELLSRIKRRGFPLISLVLFLFVTLTPTCAFAAAGGRISSGGFLSPSESFSYSSPAPSYSSPSRSYTTPLPTPESPHRYEEEDDFYIPFPEVFLPPLPRQRTVYVPVPTPLTDPVSTPPQVPTEPGGELSPPPPPPSPAFALIFLVSFGLLTVYLLTRDSLLDTNSERKYDYPKAPSQSYSRPTATIFLYRLRVALLASARDLQADLLRLAEENDTDSTEGLSQILRETTLSILRHPEKVVYCDSLTLGGGSEMEQKYLSLAFEERSKLSSEIVSSVSGTLNESREEIGSGSSVDNEFILVSALVATTQNLGQISVEDADQLHSSLVKIGSISPKSLRALEIIWQPEGETQVLTKEELLSLYPDLKAI
jgi:uncharacterized membrane protein